MVPVKNNNESFEKSYSMKRIVEAEINKITSGSKTLWLKNDVIETADKNINQFHFIF